jgi:drug/metabolite transporter (DMT)-like permease
VVNSNATEQVTVKATTTANALLPPFRFTPRMRFTVPFVIAALLFLMALLIARGSDGERRWRRNLALMSLAFTGVLLAACGGGGSNAPPPPPPSGGTPPGSYTITVNAFTMGNTTGTPDATTSVLLTVN